MIDSNGSSSTSSIGASRSAPSRPAKSAAALRTISEVATDLDVAQHVLRFWESKFPQVRPMKRGGGRRYYRPEDVELLRTIRSLLYEEGYTIKGAQKLLKGSRRYPEGDAPPPHAVAEPEAPHTPVGGTAAATAGTGSNSHTAPPTAAARPVVASPEGMRDRLEQVRDQLVSLRDMLRRAAE